MTLATWSAFRSHPYEGDFVFSVDREVRAPLRRAPARADGGADLSHPGVTSREIAALAPRAELVESWKAPDAVRDTVKRVRELLQQHTPAR